jgi:uncharacterized membrane protein YfcA
MIYLFCGVIIGVVMGLTGAGGALVAIPLFMQFLGMSLKEASVYSLLAVVVASMMNYLAQRKATQYKTAFIVIVFSALGSYLTAPYKENLPTMVVAILLALVSLYALYSVWLPPKKSSTGPIIPRENFALSLTIGLLLGALTTFTGLGGGVLMLPLFLALYRYSQSQAVATSLFAVGLSSLASLIVQVARGTRFELEINLIFLMVGILFSVLILNQFVKRLPNVVVTRTRQIVFTLVVIIALLKIF